MKASRLLIITAISMFMASYLTAQTNLVPNGSFEEAITKNGSAPADWKYDSFDQVGTTITANGQTLIPGVNAPDGTKMAFMRVKVATVTQDWDWLSKNPNYPDIVQIRNGVDYIFSFKAYSKSGAGITVTPILKTVVYALTSPTTLIDKTTYSVTPEQWNTYTVPFNVSNTDLPAGAAINVHLGFALQGSELGNLYLIDDIKIVEYTPAGVNNLKTSSVCLYPNPVVDRCCILNGNFKTAKVFNLTGSLIAECEIINNEMDFSELAAGYYMIRLKGSTQEIVKVLKK